MGVKQAFLQVMTSTRNGVSLRKRANRVAPQLSNRWEQEFGVGSAWTPQSYGEYYPRSATVYAARFLLPRECQYSYGSVKNSSGTDWTRTS